MRVIELIVTTKGETTIQTKGFVGGSCLQASKWIEQALGITTIDNKTAEYYQSAVSEQHIEQQ